MRNLIEKIKYLIAILFNVKVKVSRSKYLTYFLIHEPTHSIISITDIEVFKKRNKTIIKIVTHRPEYIIGKGAKNIDSLKHYLQDNLKDDIVIDLIENKMWHRY